MLHCCHFCCCRDVFLQKTPTNFDASVDELWTALTAGATLVVALPEAHRDVHSVMTLITRYGCGLSLLGLVWCYPPIVQDVGFATENLC